MSQFQPGRSGNPNGRPRGAAGLARYIAEQTSDGRELVDRLLALSRSSEDSREASTATLALLDRLVGKPLSSHEIIAAVTTHATAGLPAGWSSMSDGDRDAWLDELERGQTAAAHAQLVTSAATNAFADEET